MQVPDVLEEALANAGMDASQVWKNRSRPERRPLPHVASHRHRNPPCRPNAQVDWLLLHQANIRIMETVAKRLGIPMSKVLANLSEHGNTSAGSIPIALDAAVKSGKVKKGDTIACAGFGAGLSWGAAIIEWG